MDYVNPRGLLKVVQATGVGLFVAGFRRILIAMWDESTFPVTLGLVRGVEVGVRLADGFPRPVVQLVEPLPVGWRRNPWSSCRRGIQRIKVRLNRS